MKVRAVILAVALAAATCATASQPSYLKSIRPLQALRPVLNAEDEPTGEKALRNICTVTSINQGYWITAAHCVGSIVKKELGDERYIDGHLADVIKVSYEGDMALLITQDYALPAVQLATSAPKLLDTAIVAGHPFGYDALFVVKGTIANTFARLDKEDPRPYMVLQVPVAPGNSGSCVFNDRGEVISILQIGWGEGYSPVSGGAPYWNLWQFAGNYFER